ncbi:MAG TPA: carbamoyl-phosphate synthase large subunit [Solirubrobacterales bacterium]
MPRRADLNSVLVIGSGPIVIGQGCEFDYSGTQACRVLRREGLRVSLVNSNPATIMTDPEFADATYVEPITLDVLEKVIAKERPDAILPTLGGQTALNAAVELHDAGILARYQVELIGAGIETIRAGEDRKRFKELVIGLGAAVPDSRICHDLGECEQAAAELGYPVVVRPSFTLGGLGSGIARSDQDLRRMAGAGLDASPVSEVLLEESIIGWKEFELELMRDRADNVVVVCSIENIDPMGVHTGDSITVAPALTLSDKEYQMMRDASIAVLREIGVDTGGSNVQFAVNPADGHLVVIEMNPRVSRSSALASKATGFPIAKMAAKLAVGYALEEIPNDITRATPASFEPTIDYVVTKIPRFAFEKFPGSSGRLSTYMQSVGEAMSIGRTFRESFAKAMRSRELDAMPDFPADDEELLAALAIPTAERFDQVLEAFRRGLGVEAVHGRSLIDRWFLRELEALATEGDGTEGLVRTYKAVDTCAAEFEAATPYYYSAHERPNHDGSPPASEIRRETGRESVVILGAGPNRIGQGIEFDYCCVHAAMTARELGRDAVMINCNPETVSTDYDTSDRLYFEPLTAEDVLAVCAQEQPEGVIVQFGGQTPLKLARTLEEAGVPLLGTPVDAIDLAEDRGRFGALLRRLDIAHPPYGTALSAEEAEVIAGEVGFPLLVRPSYVLGGRAMEICYSTEDLRNYLDVHVKADQEHPLLLDRFLENAIEVDVDALGDGEAVHVAGIMQHVEEAGVHSGDSACVIPPLSLGEEMLEEIRATTERIALELGVIGLINIQYAIAEGRLYVIEANPRASRTVPFVSKAIGVPLAKVAARLMLGEKLADMDLPRDFPEHVSVKEAVLPFARFAGADSVLGPEMKSTGEVMGIAADFPTAFGKAQAAAGVILPREGTVFITVTDTDKAAATQLAARLHDVGFEVIATGGTAMAIERMGVPVRRINKLHEGSPHVLDLIRKRECDLVINTPSGSGARADGYEIRTAAIKHGIPSITTMTAATAAVRAIASGGGIDDEVRSLQEIHTAAQEAAGRP